MMAQEAARKKVFSSTLRRLLAYSKSFDCADAKIGDAVLFYKTANTKSAPRRRGPARILDIDVTGVTGSFQSQMFKVARRCVRKKVEEKDAVDSELDPSHERMRTAGPAPWDTLGRQDMGAVIDKD